MPAKNIYHDAVRDALVADGWTVTHDPFTLRAGQRRLYVDLAADRVALVAARGAEQIAVEVQSFRAVSDIEDLHHAVGQYVVYRSLMEVEHPDRVLYLAVPDVVFRNVFEEAVGQIVRERVGIRLLVFSPTTRRVTRWIS
jgi:hypothetical protein